MSGPDGMVLKSVTLRGPDLSADVTGYLVPSADPTSLHLDVRGSKTDLRTALRLWPEAVAPPVRRFLVGHVGGGMLDAIDLKVAMTGADMTQAQSRAGRSLPKPWRSTSRSPTGSWRPPKACRRSRRLNVTGAVSGVDVRLRAPGGKVEMGGRALDASGGSFILENYWKADATAFIDFRLTGAADGVGALLQQPLIHEIAGFEIDPCDHEGQCRPAKSRIALPVKNIPAFVDLPISVAGTLSDFGIDKIFGKDRLEGAKLAIDV